MIIPTQTEIMKRFINGNINESEIFSETENTKPFTTIYLCSIMVLEEYRNKGLAFKTSINTIQSIKESNPIESLFVWPFTAEGKLLAEKIATHLSLKIFFKNNKAR